MRRTTLREIIAVIVLSVTAMGCRITSIDSYVPQTPDEGEIIGVLKQYRDAKNDYDIDRYLACLHPDGRFSFMGCHVLTKSSLEEQLPRFWHRLRKKDATLYPMVHETVTGDFFQDWFFYRPEISVDGNTAEASVMCRAWRVCSQRHDIFLVKENGRWMISETAWHQL